MIYQDNLVAVFSTKTLKKIELCQLNNDNPLRIIFFSSKKPLKTNITTSTWKTLNKTVMSAYVPISNNGSQSINSITDLKNFEENLEKPKLVIFLDQSSRQLLPPITNVHKNRIWSDIGMNKEEKEQNFPIQVEFKEIGPSLRDYWGYILYTQLMWEMGLKLSQF